MNTAKTLILINEMNKNEFFDQTVAISEEKIGHFVHSPPPSSSFRSRKSDRQQILNLSENFLSHSITIYE
ncbi:hypothetical protein DERF_014290 [Dermatophagoides farinae]|uniref:Uncharacterized protein n=1 Tax=Dermatophagoides farinae TaxID=6954 RepID=A0A922HHE0_DERFA|nr:hypothetical protein DERF_014290 [Dermatophagoides farinae]